jgi:hypothetical protein
MARNETIREDRPRSLCHHHGVRWRLAIVLCFALACSSDRRNGLPSTNTASSAFATLDEKVAFLERYVSFRRHYLELEYGVFYQNNAGGLVPGPSDWDISVIARVPPGELDGWTNGMKRVAGQPPELSSLASELDTSGVSEWYEAMGKVLGLDRTRAIVVYRATAR